MLSRLEALLIYMVLPPGSRKAQSAKSAASEVKYCSERCKRHKPKEVDRRIESAFAALLDGHDASNFSIDGDKTNSEDAIPQIPSHAPSRGKKKVKGDQRIIVTCGEVETLMFGSRIDPEKTFGRKKNRARRGVADDEVWKSVDMEDSEAEIEAANADIHSDGSVGGVSLESIQATSESDTEETPASKASRSAASRVRPPQSQSQVNGSIGGEKGWAERIEETPEMLLKRREGQKRADEREMIRSAARRAVIFGPQPYGTGIAKQPNAGPNEKKRLCEAVMNGAVVEPSLAKGDWGIRWREE